MQVYHIQNNRHAHKQKCPFVLFTLKKHQLFFLLISTKAEKMKNNLQYIDCLVKKQGSKMCPLPEAFCSNVTLLLNN